ncbi:pre-peptidase C-terminal domain-containing protein [Prosthecobacter sp.]|uniref:pre-peptidase C-terminal domain-containing protein n=1 Tax=Prosthecobacter sp. TaxID=1965333 RepID=UPI002ABA76E3|nr:pre-peptidase C-terminal domain-containing protein [Prosthecobacter sp.]MDZ4401931.1 chitobiase/beta-hexosaminidase C-terminal domain-containing protein [Prosthecobacter sp.]
MRHTFIAVILTIASLVFTASGFSQTTLNNGQMVIGLSGSTSSQRTYRITVPTGQTKLEVKTYGGSGDADLYVKRGALPTTSSYDLSGQSGSNTETVTMYNPSPGDWFILVRAYAAYSNLTLVAAYTGPVAAAAVATPVINPGSQSTMSAVTVSMSSATSGATIRYTTNGSDPTSGSTAYVGAFPLSTSATVKARAFKSGMTDSGVATTSYTISIPSGPANNNFGSRMTITSAGGVVSGSNANATKESGEPSHASNAGGRSVWWTWTPSASGRATISTAGSSFDTLLAVYTGSAVSALTPVPLGSNDDFGSSNTSQINIAVTAGVAYQIAVDGFSGSSGSISLTVTTETPVVLLLHGMNSDPFTWNSFISDPAYFNYAPYIVPSVPTIYAGVIQGQGFPPQPATPDNKGVRYYRVKFGQYDRNPGRTGLENVVSTSSQGESGDFSSFTNHADEVRDAIANIRTSFANAKILLVGHSRGGIAGRSFLQGAASSAERNAVAGLLTVGTPHLGSPLGRIYQFLKDNPRTTSNDWRLVDELRGAAGYGAYKNSLDVRRPTIGDLASGPGLPNPPSPIDLLAQGTGNLPVGIKYGTVQFDGQAFGVVHNEPTGVQSGFVSVFFGGGAGPYTFSALTDAARNYIVSGTSIAANRGDGIVPFASQTFSGSGISVTPFANTQGILHTKEPEQKIDIRTAMKGLVNWWN